MEQYKHEHLKYYEATDHVICEDCGECWVKQYHYERTPYSSVLGDSTIWAGTYGAEDVDRGNEIVERNGYKYRYVLEPLGRTTSG